MQFNRDVTSPAHGSGAACQSSPGRAGAGGWGRTASSDAFLPVKCKSAQVVNLSHCTVGGSGWGCPPCGSLRSWDFFLQAGMPSLIGVRGPGCAMLLRVYFLSGHPYSAGGGVPGHTCSFLLLCL